MAYSSIVGPEETLWIIGNYVICSLGVVVAIFIWFILSKRVKNGEIINIKAAYFAIFSAACSIITFLSAVFLCNNGIIPWNYPSNAPVSEAVNIAAWSCGKVLFYFGFTYHILYLYNDDEKMKLFLKLWMLIFGIIVSVCCIVYIIDDALENNETETGYLDNHKIYITMYLSHEGDTLANNVALFTMMMVDCVYFGLLIFLYTKKLKIINVISKRNSKIGIILMISSSITYISFLIVMAIKSPAKWILFPIHIMVDNICLFLMFAANKIDHNYAPVKINGSDSNDASTDSQMQDPNPTDQSAVANITSWWG